MIKVEFFWPNGAIPQSRHLGGGAGGRRPPKEKEKVEKKKEK